MTKQEYLDGMGAVIAFRHDLPDGMWEAVSEQWSEVKAIMKAGRETDWGQEAELVTEICNEYGFRGPWGES